MNSLLAKFLIGLALVSGGILVILVALSRRAPELGLLDGALRPCPDSPNCVSSLAADEVHAVAPLWTGEDVAAAWAALEDHIGGLARARVVRRSDHYLRVEFTSSLLRFVDDLELHLDPDAGRIEVRSASRVGHSDLGANRDRVEALRAALGAAMR